MAEARGHFQVDLGANGVHTFTDKAELKNWLRDEQSAWDFLNGHQTPLWKTYRAFLQECTDHINNSPTVESIWPVVKGRLVALYQQVLHRNSLRGRFALGLSPHETSAAAAAYLAGHDVQQISKPLVLKGVVAAAEFDTGGAAAVESALPTLEEVKRDFSKWWADSQRTMNTDLTAAAKSREDLAQVEQRTAASLHAMEATHKGQFAKVLETHQGDLALVYMKTSENLESLSGKITNCLGESASRLAAFEATYEKKLSLHSAVTYWQRKHADHAGLASKYFKWFFASAGAGAVALIAYAWFLLPSEGDLSHIPIGRLAISAVIVTMVLWAVRALARLWLSNQHLATDASERVVMVTTYLALLKEQAALSVDDRKNVIDALFRRASTGIVKEDANPPIVFNGILKGGE